MNLSNISEILQGFWPIILFIGGAIWWLARLEFRTLSNTNRIRSLEAEKSVVTETRDLVREMNTKLELLVPNFKK